MWCWFSTPVEMFVFYQYNKSAGLVKPFLATYQPRRHERRTQETSGKQVEATQKQGHGTRHAPAGQYQI
jgi:hypothetical protein